MNGRGLASIHKENQKVGRQRDLPIGLIKKLCSPMNNGS